MAFFIPFVLGGAACGVLAWSIKMVWTKDDSADKRAAELLAAIPKKITQYVQQVEVTEKGVSIAFRQGTPQSVKDEIENKIKPLEA